MFTQAIFDNMIKFESERYWFTIDHDSVVMYDRTNGDAWRDTVECRFNLTASGDIDIQSMKFIDGTEPEPDTFSGILDAWNTFKQRPEYQVLKLDENMSPLDQYEWLLIGSRFIKEFKAGKDPDASFLKILKCLNWLRSTDFYSAPASTQYHDSYPSGLLIHSLNVAVRAIQLLQSSAFSALVQPEDAVFVSLVHDWCKIGLYEQYMKNVKDEATGKWHQEAAFRYVENRAICLGHGVSSMYLVMKFFKISIEEAAAIRHHMGTWGCPEMEINELQQANRNYPLVHLIQFADQLAIVSY